MITTGDTATILHLDCVSIFGIPVHKSGNIPKNAKGDRVVIIVKKPVSSSTWKKCFVEVNILVPDVNEVANLSRLNELERIATEKLEKTGVHDGTPYTYTVETSQEADTALKCHFVNCRVLFQILNIK